MSCVPLTDNQRLLLNLLSQGQPAPEDLSGTLAELEGWGWAMPSGELTGGGWSHVDTPEGGILGRGPNYTEHTDPQGDPRMVPSRNVVHE